MHLFELDKKEKTSEVDDNSIAQKTDTRKTRLTLKQIGRLRLLADAKTTEYKEELIKIKAQYKMPAQESSL